MRIVFAAGVSAFMMAALVGCATPPQSPPPKPGSATSEQLPMYGGQDRQSVPDLKAIDDALIQAATAEYGSRPVASERFAAQGFRYYFRDDLVNSMKLFNQGWVLDPKNPNVYWGFASVLNDKQDFCQARSMMERALEFGLVRPEGLADAGRVNMVCAMFDKSLARETKAAYIQRSNELYLQAQKAAPESAHVYGSWATASYWIGDYSTAWRHVKKQRALGGKPSERFIKLLAEKMAEPGDKS